MLGAKSGGIEERRKKGGERGKGEMERNDKYCFGKTANIFTRYRHKAEYSAYNAPIAGV